MRPISFSWTVLGAILVANLLYAQQLPDLVVTDAKFRPDPELGKTFTAYVTVMNKGKALSKVCRLDVKANGTFSNLVGQVGDQYTSVPALPVGATITLPISGLIVSNVINFATNTTRTFSAFVDSKGAVSELNKSNNIYKTTYVPIGPDLIVSRVVLPSAPRVGHQYMFQVYVKNIGTRMSQQYSLIGSLGGPFFTVAISPGLPPGMETFYLVRAQAISAGLAPTFWQVNSAWEVNYGNNFLVYTCTILN